MAEGKTKYELLVDRINEIINHFSFPQNPLEPPSEKEEDMIRAMIVLCHAEFEDYFEDLAKKLLNEGEELWKSKGVANRNISALFINSEKLKNDDKMRDMTYQSYAIKVIKSFREMIDYENHGIKSKNLKNMYVPLGYSMDNFNQDFLNELDNFGMERGKVAHLTFSRTRSLLDYNTEKEKIIRILSEISTFENML